MSSQVCESSPNAVSLEADFTHNSQRQSGLPSAQAQAQSSSGGTGIWQEQPHYPQLYGNHYSIPPPTLMSSPERPGSPRLNVYTEMEPSDDVKDDHEPADLQSLFSSPGLESLHSFEQYNFHVAQQSSYPPHINVDTAVTPYGANQYHFPSWDLSPVSAEPQPSPDYHGSPSSSVRPSLQFLGQVLQSPSYSSSSSGHQHSPHLPPGSPLISPSSSHGSHPLATTVHSHILIPTERRSATTQAQWFRDMPGRAICAGPKGPFIPQKMYKPPTNSDRLRYVEQVELEAPIIFVVENPQEDGIPLADALNSRVRRLVHRDETVFEGRGPSISIRLVWPCYRPWSRQIPTRDFRSPPGPITRAKLAKNVAKNVERFINEKQKCAMEEDSDTRWKVGPNDIKLEDLVLVSLHHVSRGSWQPHLRLRRQLF